MLMPKIGCSCDILLISPKNVLNIEKIQLKGMNYKGYKN